MVDERSRAFGAAVEAACERLGLRIGQAALRADMNPTWLDNACRGVCCPTDGDLVRLEDVLGFKRGELMKLIRLDPYHQNAAILRCPVETPKVNAVMCNLCSQLYDNSTNKAHACAPSDVAETQAARIDVLTEELEETRDRLAAIENAMGLSDERPSIIEEEDDSDCWHENALNGVLQLLLDEEPGKVAATMSDGRTAWISVQFVEAGKA